MEVPVPFSLEKSKALKKVIAPQSGFGFTLHRGQRLTVVDPEGEQVADLFCYSRENPQEALSSGRSIDYNDSFLFRRGHTLFGQSGRPMLVIEEDTLGRHDFLVTPCSLQMFHMLGVEGYHPSCLENLERALADFPVNSAQIGTSFNIFMHVAFDENGKIAVKAPLSRAGEKIVFRAEMDLYVALTACSDEDTNNGRCKPIEFEIQ